MIKKRSGPIRALVVDDSPTVRAFLVALLSDTEDIQVIGTAQDGVEAIRLTARLKPDVVTMDIQMPNMDGLEATRCIMKLTPVPIVIVTASLNQKDMDLSFQALRVGALTVIRKPGINNPADCAQVVQTVRLMADVAVVHRFGKTRPLPSLEFLGLKDLPDPNAGAAANLPIPTKHPNALRPSKTAAAPAAQPAPASTGDLNRVRTIVGMASSTGGPGALVTALKPLPANYPLPVLIVQHITRGFAASLCEWMNSELKLQVHLAQAGEVPLPGQVLLAPDDMNMTVSPQGRIVLDQSTNYKGLRPSANFLFSSMARVYGRQAIGVILTGMGDDGADGLLEMHNQGAVTIAQDEDTSVVFGMPREAITRQAVDHVLAIDQVGLALMQLPYFRA